ncbi:Pyridoxal phosphate-dependent transferase, major domain protein [Ophiocordyceps camponoti-floridani]|uniref:Pyridoxal phosphate-dependent transferase, major domain protein n=1 Tax=Ophiocordyceps camponoti-floridani TaxID=2030778 RepID=A0A8H4Q0Q5_9HYPO|nr:Pyridoxal phosphate-dependent transferase, major domain protein [Ophiocordyceps camponoti-floridani]
MDFTEASFQNRFPAVKNGNHVFLDNAGGTQTLDTVVDSVRDYLAGGQVQLGASYETSQICSRRYAAAHQAAARFVNASPDEVVFGASATQLLRNLAATFNFNKGDEIIVSAIDHEANIAPWLDLARRQDLVIRWWRPKINYSSGLCDPQMSCDTLGSLLSTRTRLVALTHVSNILGTVNDVAAIAELVHQHDALVCVDGVAFAPHRPVDVKELDVDFYVFSWYKIFGPHIATLYASWSAQTRMHSLSHFFNPSATLDNKLGLAAASYELCQSITHVADYLDRRVWDAIDNHESWLQAMLLDCLGSKPGVTIYGKQVEKSHLRLPIISFTAKGWDSKDLVEAIEKYSDYGIRWGSFYSNRLVRDTLRLGEHGVVRVSMVHYNTRDDMKGLIMTLDKLLPST